MKRRIFLTMVILFFAAGGLACYTWYLPWRAEKRIADNEAAAITACKTYCGAQDIYRRTDHDHDGMLEYAQSVQEPFADLIGADLATAFEGAEPRIPYQGYFFKIVTRQSDNGPGGEKDFVVASNMTKGYALVAYPAEYGVSGRNSFAVSNTGTVYQFDWGPVTHDAVAEWTYLGEFRVKREYPAATLLKWEDNGKGGGAAHVTATLDHPLNARENVIWCASMPMMWNVLRDYFDENIELTGDPSTAVKLNALPRGAAWVKDEACFVHAGRGAAAVKSIVEGMRARFPGAPMYEFLEHPTVDDYFAFAYLEKSLAFPKPFERPKETLRFDGASVMSFGVWEGCANNHDLRAQVVLWDYASDDDFVAEVRTQSVDERLLIAHLPPKATLDATVRDVLKRADKPKALHLHDTDRFEMPIMHFEITRVYEELLNKSFKRRPTYGFVDARQMVRFKLDEKGAELVSFAAGWVISNGGEPPRPRMLICDGPFLLLLIEKDRPDPYLALWIANPTILAKTP